MIDPIHSEALQKLEAAQRQAAHAGATREQYARWVVRYRNARIKRICHDLQSFLTFLSVEKKVNPKTVKQAVNALKFYHEKVLGIEILPNSLTIPRVNKNRNIPDILTPQEVHAIVTRMAGVPRLQAEMLYGTSSRITALLKLRLKDIDLAKNLVTFRFDKGGKSRTVRLPEYCREKLIRHIAAVRSMWEQDQRHRIIYPVDDPSLMRKLGERRFGTIAFCWLFPSREVRGNYRWHATDRALTEATRRAVEDAGIMKRVSPHTFRHSSATTLIELGENIRTIQDHLGHADVKTTEIYTHAVGSRAVISPLDRIHTFLPSCS